MTPAVRESSFVLNAGLRFSNEHCDRARARARRELERHFSCICHYASPVHKVFGCNAHGTLYSLMVARSALSRLDGGTLLLQPAHGLASVNHVSAAFVFE